MKLKAVLTAALLLMPTAALAAPGVVTVSTGLRAGPGDGFPLVDRIPGGSRVNVHGCLRGYAWCDVSWSDDRGWVSSEYLEYLYRNKYVYLPDYVDVIDAPVVPFVLGSYWSSYYAGRPWFHRRAYWSNYWTSHQRVATRLRIDRSAARIGRAATRNGAIAEGRTPRAGIAERMTREQGSARIRDQRVTRGQAAMGRAAAVRDNGAARANARIQPTVRGREAPRISAMPAARQAMPRVAQPRTMPRIAQPNVSRAAPMSAHAQAPAPRAAPAMPHAGGGRPAGGGGRGNERR